MSDIRKWILLQHLVYFGKLSKISICLSLFFFPFLYHDQTNFISYKTGVILVCMKKAILCPDKRAMQQHAEDAPALRERKRSNSFAGTSGSGRRQSIKKEPSASESTAWEPGMELQMS